MSRAIKPEPSGGQQEMPHWAAYLDRLGSQAKRVAGTPIWTGVPVSVPENHLPEVEDRRSGVETRRQRIEAPDVSESPAVQPSSRPADPTTGVRYGIRRPTGDRRTGSRRRSEARARGLSRIWNLLTSKTRRATDNVGLVLFSRLSLGMWGFYFAAKLGMYWKELIDFHAWENLVFAVFILLPVTSKILYRGKFIFAVVIATALLYYDSWLPPVNRVFAQASQLSSFSFSYLVELSARFFDWQTVVLLFISGFLYWLLSRRIRMGMLVLACLLPLTFVQRFPAWDKNADQAMPDMEKYVQYFFEKEATRSVLFVTPKADATPFDVIFIHVCSLSWDDVRAVGLEEHPLWSRFDIMLTRFNSAASYSGPAALHLLRAKCGQPQHGGMYTPVADKCYLMDSLQRSGFEQNLVLNHDGRFDDFMGQVRKHGRVGAQPMPLSGLEVAQYAFDKSPVYDDLSVLGRWLETRQGANSARVALYYNTVSMHDGNHFKGADAAVNTLGTYKARLLKFLDETESFMKKLEASGRRAVVVMVPEHGAAVRGDKMQLAGLREIPTPAISLVPVGIKVIGARREAETLIIDEPTSYLAVSYIVERMLEQSPYDNDSFNPEDYRVGLPGTIFVSQNEATTVAESLGKYYLSRGAGKWQPYAEFNKSDAP